MSIDPIELSKDLISCPSVTPADEGALQVLQSALESMGFKCDRVTFSDDQAPSVDNLYARLGEDGPNLCFAGHTDVVPPGNLDDWQSNPFKPEIRDGVLYGRGVVDMKCAIACFAAAVSRYLENNKLKGSISFLITGDEEGDAINGTKKLLQHIENKGEKIDACIVGEPTSENQVGDTIKIGRRGSVTFDLLLIGKQGHVAYPHLADNPISRLTRILHELDSHELDSGTEYFQPSNLEIVGFEVDNKTDNVIPAVARAKFNIRFNDKHKSATLIKWVEGICESICEVGDASFELKYRVSGESFLTKPGELSSIVQSSVDKIAKIEGKLSTAGGTSDARFIKDFCPVVEIGLLNATAHKVDESAPVADIELLADIYADVIESYFKQIL
ncbi:succinyl-diaminopimelate desuccinylase [Rickettsiales bacterium]|nr:succinyl-diaminopimelate desuccinylase [Rickettsiales bacterium]